jgi:hypothetical protein
MVANNSLCICYTGWVDDNNGSSSGVVNKCNKVKTGFSNFTENNNHNDTTSTGNQDNIPHGSDPESINSTNANTNETNTDQQQEPAPVNITLIIIIVACCVGLCCMLCSIYLCYKCYTRSKAKEHYPTILPTYLQKPIEKPDIPYNNPHISRDNSVVRKLTYVSPVKEERNIRLERRGIERSIYRTPNIVVEDDPYNYPEEDYYVQSIPNRRYIIDRNYTEIPRTRAMRRMYPSYTEY